MKVLKESVGGVVVLTLKGEFDSFVTKAFGNEITKVQAEGNNRIVVNLHLLKFVNSTALGAMIKARKSCRAANGDLVVSQPSETVREAMGSLGLDRLFSIYDSDEDALGALEGAGSVEMEDESASTVMIHTPESTRPQLARLKKLDADTLDCRLATDVGKLVEGREVRLKFRLPLYRKEYFDLSARIDRLQESPGGTLLSLRFTQVSEEDREAIESFVEDMSELRKAARGAE